MRATLLDVLDGSAHLVDSTRRGAYRVFQDQETGIYELFYYPEPAMPGHSQVPSFGGEAMLTPRKLARKLRMLGIDAHPRMDE